jgi:Lon-like protease
MTVTVAMTPPTMTATTSDTSTLDPSVATAPPPPGRPRRTTLWMALGVLGVLIASVIGAALVPVPYLTIRPGTVRPVGHLVTVADVEAHPSQSPVSFTTVRISGSRVSLLQALAGWIDGDTEVVPEERIVGGRTSEENRRFNAQLMDTSKQVAITVALRHLGYDVDIRTSGSVIAGVLEGSPAEGVLRRGDVILAVGDRPVEAPAQLGELLQDGGPGATHVLSVEREPGAPATEITLATQESPDEPGRAVLGILVEERIVDFDFPFPVTIDSGTVGGPSAGLAFTLAVLDHLTPGEITGGARVAATGTIDLAGRVGPVGGVPQKAVAVRDEGYDVFLVPEAEAEAVAARMGDGLRVVGVGTLQDALEVLASLGGNALALGQPGRDRVAA